MALRVGISGAGYIVPFHIAGWHAAGAEVVAIADPDTERCAARAAEAGIGRTHASLDAMLADGGLDALDIASPRQVHMAQVRAGLAAGLPVMCQKPVAPTYDEAAELAAKMGPRDRVMVHENWRFRPEYRQIGQWLAAGALGSLRYASIAMRTTAMLKGADGTRPAEHRQPFMLSEPRLVLAEVLIHDVDAMRFLLGDLRLLHATGRRTEPELPGETSATLFMTAETDLAVVVSGDMTAYGAPPGASDSIEIIGQHGRVVFDRGALTLHADRQETMDFTGRNLLQESATAAIGHFVQRLHDGHPFETDLRDNLKTLRIIEDAYAAIG